MYNRKCKTQFRFQIRRFYTRSAPHFFGPFSTICTRFRIQMNGILGIPANAELLLACLYGTGLVFADHCLDIVTISLQRAVVSYIKRVDKGPIGTLQRDFRRKKKVNYRERVFLEEKITFIFFFRTLCAFFFFFFCVFSDTCDSCNAITVMFYTYYALMLEYSSKFRK